MSIDDELLAQMALQEESPDDPRQRRQKKITYAQSEYTAGELKEKVGDRVWIKCISELQPWADDKPLKFWGNYFVTAEDAISLDERRFAVILHSKEALNQQEKPKTLKLQQSK
jgi:hypothetical protein